MVKCLQFVVHEIFEFFVFFFESLDSGGAETRQTRQQQPEVGILFLDGAKRERLNVPILMEFLKLIVSLANRFGLILQKCLSLATQMVVHVFDDVNGFADWSIVFDQHGGHVRFRVELNVPRLHVLELRMIDGEIFPPQSHFYGCQSHDLGPIGWSR